MIINQISFGVEDIGGGFTVYRTAGGCQIDFDCPDAYWECDSIDAFSALGPEEFAKSFFEETEIDISEIAQDIWVNIIMQYGFLTR